MFKLISVIVFCITANVVSASDCSNLSHIAYESSGEKWVMKQDKCGGFEFTKFDKTNSIEMSYQYIAIDSEWQTVSHDVRPGLKSKKLERWFWNVDKTEIIHEQMNEDIYDRKQPPFYPYDGTILRFNTEAYSLDSSGNIAVKGSTLDRNVTPSGTSVDFYSYKSTMPKL